MSTTRGQRSLRALGVLGVSVSMALSVPASSTAAPAAPSKPAAHVKPAPQRFTDKNPTAYGSGGAVSSVDPEATAAGLKVLRQGGNAVDAAVATAATLGVTEPYSAGIGGGGYFVYYNAHTGKISTIDGRETAPKSMPSDAFVNPATKTEYTFDELVTSGRSVGVPGTPATWQTALKSWGTLSLGEALKPATRVARRGFVVDQTFNSQTDANKKRFAQIESTKALYLPQGAPPAVGSIFRNQDLAHTYDILARRGTKAIYSGAIGRDIVNTVKNIPKTPSATLPMPTGYLKNSDLKGYSVVRRAPTKVRYRGYDVYSIAPSSSGGSTVGEALNILSTHELSAMPRAQALHYYLDASALAFADRNAYVGDPAFVKVPLKTLLSKKFARSRACLITPDTALPTPTKPGMLDAKGCQTTVAVGKNDVGTSTSHLVTSDRWGNVVSYTLTIEQTGGAGIVVPGRGFLLNNELTDFTTKYDPADPNRLEGGKRPRSSMAPTIVLQNGKPFLAVGSPGGATIITTVLQTLVNRIDLGMTLPDAVAEPRASNRNLATVPAEPAFLDKYRDQLAPYKYPLVSSGDTLTTDPSIGAVAALQFFPHGRVQAVAEPVRRGGGDAQVVRPQAP